MFFLHVLLSHVSMLHNMCEVLDGRWIRVKYERKWKNHEDSHWLTQKSPFSYLQKQNFHQQFCTVIKRLYHFPRFRNISPPIERANIILLLTDNSYNFPIITKPQWVIFDSFCNFLKRQFALCEPYINGRNFL